MITKLVNTIFVASFTIYPAFADSGWGAVYTGLVAPGSEHRQIEMAAEEVNVQLKTDSANVEAIFHFANNGPTTDVEMVFPLAEMSEITQFDFPPGCEPDRTWFFESINERYGLDETTFNVVREVTRGTSYNHGEVLESYDDFGLFIDGKIAGFDLIEINNIAEDYKTAESRLFARWQVTFLEGERREIRCTYNAPYDQERHGWGPHCFNYALYTGADWAGPIGDGVIKVINDTDSALWFTTPDTGKLKPAIITEAEGRDILEYSFTDFEPSPDCIITVALGQGISDDDLPVVYEDIGLSAGRNIAGKTTIKMNFRNEPSSEAAKVAGHPTLAKDTPFEVLRGKGEWWLVRLGDGTEGWLRWRYADPDSGDENIYAVFYPGLDWGG